MISDVGKFAPAIACGKRVHFKRPSERDPGVPMELAKFDDRGRGLPPGILNVVNGDKEAVCDAILDDPDIKAVGFVGSSPIAQYIYEAAPAATGKRAQCFGGAKKESRPS